MFNPQVTMRMAKYFILIFCLLFFDCGALNCKSDGGPKENELKKVYNLCMKQQEGSNNSNGRGDNEQDWRGTRRYNQWSQDNMARNRGNDKKDYRTSEWDNGNGGSRMENNRDRMSNQNKMRGQNRNSNSRDNRMESNEDSYTRDGRDERQNRNSNNRYGNGNGVSARNDFFQNDDYGGYNNNNQYSTQSSRRYKRERRVEMNSGKRSQYNPNPQRFSGNDDKYKEEDKNSNESNSTYDEDTKACALHCLLENLQMTGENGMPDRYLVTHKITKDIRDEDLKDFLQESIEECFQILDSENTSTEEKCEFSKNLLMCLSDKGRANCDDWKDDYQF